MRLYTVSVMYSEPYGQNMEVAASSPGEAARRALEALEDNDDDVHLYWNEIGSSDPAWVESVTYSNSCPSDCPPLPVPLDCHELKRWTDPAELREILVWALEVAAEWVDAAEKDGCPEDEIDTARQWHGRVDKVGAALFGPHHWNSVI